MADDADVVERLMRRAAARRGGLRTFVAGSDLVDRLRACLRENVIWKNIRMPGHGTCGNCNGKWSDGIEAHEPGCLAALTTTEKIDVQP